MTRQGWRKLATYAKSEDLFGLTGDWLFFDLDAEVKTHNNSQTYIGRTVKDLTFWPDEWCVLFKVQCVPPWPQRFWKEPVLPPAARVVAFPGMPNPHQAVAGEWPVETPIKTLYKTIRPARWINDYWK